MNEENKIIKALTDFTEGADAADIDRLERSLHSKFTNIQNGYFEKTGVHVIDKTSYLDHVKGGRFGGVMRKMRIGNINVHGDMSVVEATLTSDILRFRSHICLVRESGECKVVVNFPKIELIKQP